MSQAVTQSRVPRLRRAGILSHLVGAVFTKELRVSARRLRFYLLRMSYVGLLTLFVALTWSSTVSTSFTTGAYAASRMAEAGKAITMTVLWFQFIAVQLVGMVLLSDSISGEVHARTMGILLTTPLTSWQLVAGKLLARLVHVLLLVVLSLPLLAIVRLFGGVPWSTLIAGICISLTAAIFAGTVTMFYSTMFRRTYAIILLGLATLFALFFVIPALVGLMLAVMLSSGGGSGAEEFLEGLAQVFVHLHPYASMSMISIELGSPGAMPFSFYWPVHCIIMLLLSLGVLGLCSRLVRRVTFNRVLGGRAAGRSTLPARPAPPGAPPPLPATATGSSAKRPLAGPPRRAGQAIRRIRGSPVLWKELRTGLFRVPSHRIAAALVCLGVVVAFYALIASLDDVLMYRETQALFVYAFFIAGMVVTGVIAGTTVSAEKEARTLPLLLCTNLSAEHIIFGKVLGVLRRAAPVWAWLFAHVLIFTFLGAIRPSGVVHLAIVAAWVAIFLAGSGVLFSTIFKKTSTAIVANIGLSMVLWLIAPMVLDWPADLLCGNPFVQINAIMTGAGTERFTIFWSSESPQVYEWPFGEATAGTTTAILMASLLVYGIIGLVLAGIAAIKLRRSAA